MKSDFQSSAQDPRDFSHEKNAQKTNPLQHGLHTSAEGEASGGSQQERRSVLADTVDELLDQLKAAPGLLPSDIPSIDLYMDQVTSLMESSLSFTRRGQNDKILTKTMINNYAKNHLLPPPQKKKYSKDHLLLLVFIYYFKNILSLQDIQAVMEPLCSHFFHTAPPDDIEEIYSEAFSFSDTQIEQFRSQLQEYERDLYPGTDELPSPETDFLRFFTLLCRLNMDIYIRKRTMEKLIDSCKDTILSPDKSSSRK